MAISAPRFRAALGLTPAVLAACTTGSVVADGTTFRDSAGVAIAESDHTRPAWGARGWRFSEAPLVQIGGENAEGPEQLHGVTHSQLLPNGTFAIVSSLGRQVPIFTPDGRHLRTIGRSGEGPGEYRSPWQVFSHGADSLVVVDIYRSISVFDTAGRFGRRFVPGGLVGESQGAPLGRFGDGTFLFQLYHNEIQRPPGLQRGKVELVRFSMEGAHLQSFGFYEEQTYRVGSTQRHIFGPWGKFGPAGTAFWYGPGDRFDIRLVDLEGVTTRMVRLDLPPRPVTDADVDGFRDRLLERSKGTREERFAQEMAENIEAADVFPPHDELLVDDLGNLWVQEFQPWDLRVPRTWHVFDPNGRYLGPLTTPSGFFLYQVRDHHAIGRWNDEFDVEHVRVYRIEKP